MRRFERRHSFAWTFFVLIFASFWNGATIKPEIAFSDASRSALAESSSLTPETTDAAFRRDVPEFAFSSAATREIFETFRNADARRLQRSTRRHGGDDFSFSSGSTKSPLVREFPFADPAFASAVFRSFWDRRSASRPLFLIFRSLRN